MDERTDAYSSPINIGLDPGFGATLAAWVGLNGAQVATVPSVVGVGSTDLGLLLVGNLGRRRRACQPDRVAFDEITYLVGDNVARYARPEERMGYLRLTDRCGRGDNGFAFRHVRGKHPKSHSRSGSLTR